MVRSISKLSTCYHHRSISVYMTVLQNEFIYGGHLTALGAPMMVLFVSILLNIHVSLQLLFIAYLAPLIVYSVDYHKSMEKDKETNPGRSSYLSTRSGVYPYLIAFYTLLLLASLILFARGGLMLLIIALAICGVLYSTVFKGLTKKLPGFKNVFTSAVWASGCAFGLPMYYSMPFEAVFGLVFLFMLVRGLSNNIFFDLKDIESDAAEGLKTLPVLLGERRMTILLLALDIAALPILLLGVYLGQLPMYALSMIALVFSTFLYLSLVNSGEGKRMGYPYYLLADVEVLFWPVALVIGKMIYLA
jgi:4-hydroxybenzoate polyprenyltransferase